MIRFMMGAMLVVGLAGCSGRLAYAPPAVQPDQALQKTVHQAFDRTWTASLQSLARHGFVITATDRKAGLVSATFSGDPQKYLDCGTIESEVTDAHGTRHYQFPGAAGHQDYEQIMRGNLYDVSRTVALEARINLLLQPSGRQNTQASVNVRYEVTRTVHIANATQKYYEPVSDAISFTSRSMAAFPGLGRSTECRANGALEREVLDALAS